MKDISVPFILCPDETVNMVKKLVCIRVEMQQCYVLFCGYFKS